MAQSLLFEGVFLHTWCHPFLSIILTDTIHIFSKAPFPILLILPASTLILATYVLRIPFLCLWCWITRYSVSDVSKESNAFETPGIYYPVTKRHMPEDINSQTHSLKNSKIEYISIARAVMKDILIIFAFWHNCLYFSLKYAVIFTDFQQKDSWKCFIS